jgi:hypothetical protein
MPDDYFRLEWLQYLTGSPLLSLLALLVVGAIYFLAPAVGYTTYNRGLLLGAVWVLIAKMGLVIFKIGIALIEEMDKGSSSSSSGAFPPGSGSGSGPGKYSAAGPVMALIFFMLDSGLFVLALALFAGGLASLRREADARPLGARHFPPPRDRE